jgi:hypothetical protein
MSNEHRVARVLGWFSIGLGAAELLAPKAVCRSLRVDCDERLVQAFGAREIAAGVGILSQRNPTPWLWGRVAGDAVDEQSTSRHGRGRHRQRHRHYHPRRRVQRQAESAPDNAGIVRVISTFESTTGESPRWINDHESGLPGSEKLDEPAEAGKRPSTEVRFQW